MRHMLPSSHQFARFMTAFADSDIVPIIGGLGAVILMICAINGMDVPQ